MTAYSWAKVVLRITLFKKAALLKVAFLMCLSLFINITPYRTADAAQRQSCFSQHLCFITIETNKSAKLLVRNDFDIAIRVSVKVKAHNTKPVKDVNNIPLLPDQTKEAFFIKAKLGKTWRYTWTSELHPGLNEVIHDSDTLYTLPYSPKATYSISQGPNGSFSHFGTNNNAIDWAMPVGTEIHAAREGIVVGYRESSSRGGPSAKYKSEHNYIWIEHSDGTIGQYL
ncbi:M23 family metallopeptidase [Kiloniella sp.]|uniref:M23 family metallopeptidase n=1 Tax=Kiloniella sp. TaxID=1938587 RepID=UPI003B01DDAE